MNLSSLFIWECYTVNIDTTRILTTRIGYNTVAFLHNTVLQFPNLQDLLKELTVCASRILIAIADNTNTYHVNSSNAKRYAQH